MKGLDQASALADLLQGYRRVQGAITETVSTYDPAVLAGIVENLRRLSGEAVQLSNQLDRRLALMPTK